MHFIALGLMMIVSVGGRNSGTSATPSTSTVEVKPLRYEAPQYKQNPHNVSVEDKGAAAILFYNTECANITPDIPFALVQYAYFKAQHRVDQYNAAVQEIENAVTTNGLQRTLGVNVWCNGMWTLMGKEWSKLR
jgi:hypothetical protein